MQWGLARDADSLINVRRAKLELESLRGSQVRLFELLGADQLVLENCSSRWFSTVVCCGAAKEASDEPALLGWEGFTDSANGK